MRRAMRRVVIIFALVVSFSAWSLDEPRIGTDTTPGEVSIVGNVHTATMQPMPRVDSYSLPPAKLRKAEVLYKTRTVLYLAGTLYGIAMLRILLALRIAPLYRDLAERISRWRFVQAVIFVPLLLVTLGLLSLPIEVYRHHLQLAYGLSVQGWGSWLWDQSKAEMVSFVVLVPVVWALYAIIRRSPARWWLYAWIAALPVLAFVVFVSPVLLDPIFNRFEPLEKTRPDLVTAIERVVQRGGLHIPRSHMFEMKASDKVTTYNAYVTGIGPTKRVVVWDNTARDMTVGETLFIFGHEMGHYVLDHILKGLVFAAVLMLGGLWLGRKLVNWALARWRGQWQIRELADWASLPVLLLVLAVLSFVVEPVANGFSRHIEHQADVYGLEVIHGIVPNSPEVAAEDFQLLGEKALSYPYPSRLFVFWAYDHPPIADRLRFALTYNPWAEGHPTRYVH